MLTAECGVRHALFVAFKIASLGADRLCTGWLRDIEAGQESDEFLNLAAIEFRLMADHPTLLTWEVAGMQKANKIPEMLARMRQSTIWTAPGKWVRIVPDPHRSVADDYLPFGAIPGFPIESLAELSGGLNSASLGGGVRIADSIALFIPSCLCEDAAEFDFASVGRPLVLPVRPSVSFLTTRTPVPAISM